MCGKIKGDTVSHLLEKESPFFAMADSYSNSSSTVTLAKREAPNAEVLNAATEEIYEWVKRFLLRSRFVGGLNPHASVADRSKCRVVEDMYIVPASGVTHLRAGELLDSIRQELHPRCDYSHNMQPTGASELQFMVPLEASSKLSKETPPKDTRHPLVRFADEFTQPGNLIRLFLALLLLFAALHWLFRSTPEDKKRFGDWVVGLFGMMNRNAPPTPPGVK